MIYFKDLWELVYDPEYVLIDLREKDAFEKNHIVNAVNLPLDKYEKWVRTLPDKKLIFYCEYGNDSLMVAKKLKEQGFQSYALADGFSSIDES